MACRVMMSSAVTPAMVQQQQQQPSKSSSATRSRQSGDTTMPVHLAGPPYSLTFVYGTLKQGFSNHWLIEDVVGRGHAHFIGMAKTKHPYPLVCGPFQVPFLLNMPNSGVRVIGELYAVNQLALEVLDELEGVSKGHYQRCPLLLTGLQSPDVDSSEVEGEAYFAYPALQRGLSSAPHIDAYTKKETLDYVYRKDRPKNRTFREHVEHWINAQGPRSYICK